jgi:hypothetical protein
MHCKEFNVAKVPSLDLVVTRAGDVLCHDRVATMGKGPSG